jgi:hypothetical protein
MQAARSDARRFRFLPALAPKSLATAHRRRDNFGQSANQKFRAADIPARPAA